MKMAIINTGGTLGMTGKPLRPAKSAVELMEGVLVGQDIELDLIDFPDRLDSTNITYKHRLQMGQIIDANYKTHDAFIFLHGTDTLAETTSFLSMLFRESLQKPAFVIGSQKSKDEPGSDAKMQIENTLSVADSFVKKEVAGVYSVCMSDVLLGARVMKRADSNYNAFYTPGTNPVAHAYLPVQFNDGLRYCKKRKPALKLYSAYEENVVTLVVSADSPPWALMDLVQSDRIKGGILECKGAGQIPNRKWWDNNSSKEYSWIDAIEEATKRNIPIGIVSPFEDGTVNLKRYELGQEARKAGAVSLRSLTPAMADVKFRMAIAQCGTNPKDISTFIKTNFVGELRAGFSETDEYKVQQYSMPKNKIF